MKTLKTNPNDVAFNPRIVNDVNPGLTKREYFAGLAMQGLCVVDEGEDTNKTAQIAIGYADALIEELNKE